MKRAKPRLPVLPPPSTTWARDGTRAWSCSQERWRSCILSLVLGVNDSTRTSIAELNHPILRRCRSWTPVGFHAGFFVGSEPALDQGIERDRARAAAEQEYQDRAPEQVVDPGLW